MISERQLALNWVGKQVVEYFSAGDMETAWLFESFQQKLESMTDEQFIDQYLEKESDNVI